MAWRKPTNLREWLLILFRHKKKFFFPAVVTMILVVWAAQFLPREYRAEAIFERRTEGMTDSKDTASERLLDPIRSLLVQDIKNRAAVEQLVEDLGMTRNLPHNADNTLTAEGQRMKTDMVEAIQGKLGVRFQTQTEQVDRIMVSYTDANREDAPRIVNRLVSNYIDRTKSDLSTRLVNARTFFEQEVARNRDKVAELETKKLQFEQNNPGLLPDDPASVQVRLAQLRARLEQIDQELQTSDEKRKSLQTWVDSQPEMIEKKLLQSNPERDAALSRRAQLQAELDDHLTRWRRTEDHPSVKRVRELMAQVDEQIATLDKEVPGGTEMTPNPQRNSAIQEIKSLTGTIVALERQRDEARKEIDKLEILNRNYFVIRNEYQRIVRELEEAQSQLEFWETNKNRTQLQFQKEAGEQGVRFKFQQRASDLPRPSSPDLVKIIGMAIIMGLGIGVAMIVLAELLDHSIHSVEHATDELKLPVFGTVNEIIPPNERYRRKLMSWTVYPAVGTVLVVILLGAFWLTQLSLEDPVAFQSLKKNPAGYVKRMLLG